MAATCAEQVLSVTLDDWSDEEIDALVEIGGNAAANSIYEAYFPEGVKKPGPHASNEERSKYIRSDICNPFLCKHFFLLSFHFFRAKLHCNINPICFYFLGGFSLWSIISQLILSLSFDSHRVSYFYNRRLTLGAKHWKILKTFFSMVPYYLYI